MLDFYYYYLLFAITVSLVTFIIYYLPALYRAKSEKVNNTFTRYLILSSVIFIVITGFMAPFIATVVIMSMFSKVDKFQVGLEGEMLKSDN